MIDLDILKKDAEVKAIMDGSKQMIEVLGFTEHSVRHSSVVSKWAGDILRSLSASEREVNLAEVAGYLHDIGNSISREDHAQSGALLAYGIVKRLGMNEIDAVEVLMAIGNHDEKHGVPISKVSSAIIIADKADVHFSRVNKDVLRPGTTSAEQNIHDRVNLAAQKSYVEVEDGVISINIIIDENICSPMDYLDIYYKRMQMCRKAAEFLGCAFSLKINGVNILS